MFFEFFASTLDVTVIENDVGFVKSNLEIVERHTNRKVKVTHSRAKSARRLGRYRILFPVHDF